MNFFNGSSIFSLNLNNQVVIFSGVMEKIVGAGLSSPFYNLEFVYLGDMAIDMILYIYIF